MSAPSSLVAAGVIAEMCRLAGDCPAGCFVEVGVYQGGTAWHLLNLAKQQGRELFAYDTFDGIPYSGEFDSHRVGDFSDTSYEQVLSVLPGANVVKGLFPESAVPMPPVAFAHLDCDQYQSIREACLFLQPKMVQGGVIWFDDYGCLDGATRAVEEMYGGSINKSASGGKVFVTF